MTPIFEHGKELYNFKEITKDEYWYFLEVMPPLYHERYGFMLQEVWHSFVTMCLVEFRGKFYQGYVNLFKVHSGEVTAMEFYEDMALNYIKGSK